MPKNKRLHFKYINSIRGIIFFPVFICYICTLLSTEKTVLLNNVSDIFLQISKGSFDFLFFLTSFLITSHALREYKYIKSFSYRNFLIRRFIRLSIVLLLSLLFAFFMFPWLENVLDLQPRTQISTDGYLLLIPNYKLSLTPLKEPLFMAVFASIFMLIQFHVVWGIVLKFLNKQLLITSCLLILVGVVVRLIYLTNNEIYLLDTLAYGVPFGAGSLVALLFRSESPFLEKLKNTTKQLNIAIYFLGTAFFVLGYVLVNGTWMEALIPIFLNLFFSYIMVEQTFGRNSLFRLKNRKVLTYLGKISFGLFIYQAICGILIMIALGSLGKLDAEELSVSTILIIVAGTLTATIMMADVSYKLFEKPLMRIRREFKKV